VETEVCRGSVKIIVLEEKLKEETGNLKSPCPFLHIGKK
jgi:hypothetical protein